MHGQNHIKLILLLFLVEGSGVYRMALSSCHWTAGWLWGLGLEIIFATGPHSVCYVTHLRSTGKTTYWKRFSK